MLRLPAEWEPQSMVLMGWPPANEDWAWQLKEARVCCASIAATISQFEPVMVVGDGEGALPLIENEGGNLDRVTLFECPTDDVWLRDTGPITTFDQDKRIAHDFRFDAWGKKHSYDLDAKIGERLAVSGGLGEITWKSHDTVLEGGAIESNGADILMATRQCLLGSERNAGWSAEDYERLFSESFGAKIYWIDGVILDGDDTDTHVDTLARFTENGTLVYVDEHLAMDSLNNARKFTGENVTAIQSLPHISVHSKRNGKTLLPASYANFLVINGAVLVPSFALPEDYEAVSIIQKCFPGREVILKDCLPLIEQRGALHCLCMQIPAGELH